MHTYFIMISGLTALVRTYCIETLFNQIWLMYNELETWRSNKSVWIFRSCAQTGSQSVSTLVKSQTSKMGRVCGAVRRSLLLDVSGQPSLHARVRTQLIVHDEVVEDLHPRRVAEGRVSVVFLLRSPSPEKKRTRRLNALDCNLWIVSQQNTVSVILISIIRGIQLKEVKQLILSTCLLLVQFSSCIYSFMVAFVVSFSNFRFSEFSFTHSIHLFLSNNNIASTFS